MPDDITVPSDERIERLMCRSLDREASEAERAELAGILLRDPAARLLYEEYRQLDALARKALRCDAGLEPRAGGPQSPSRRRHDLWWTAVGAVATAAAVVVFSLLPVFRPQTETGGRPVVQKPFPTGSESPAFAPSPTAWSSAEYRAVDHVPSQRVHDLHRDVIGIRGKDKNVIYIFERNRQSTTVLPISGDI